MTRLSGHPILPVYIGGNLKIGMRKGDKILQVNPDERYIYDIKVLEPIFPGEFEGLVNGVAVKKCTDKLQKAIMDEKEKSALMKKL